MATRITQASFTRGELTPRLDSRTNLEQYDIGLKKAKNAIIHQEGGISNRNGLEFCGTAKYNNKHTRLMKFVFNSEQTYMLEVGEKYIRFLKEGAYIIYPEDYGNSNGIETIYDDIYSTLTTSNNLTSFLIKQNDDATSCTVKLYCKATTKFAGEKVYKDSGLTQYYGYISELDDVVNGTVTILKEIVVTDSEKAKLRGEIVEIETPYLAEDLKLIKKSQAGDCITFTHYKYPPKNLVRYSHCDWKLEDIDFKAMIKAPIGVTATFSADTPTSNQRTYSYVVTAVDKDNTESERSEVVECVAHREANWVLGETVTIRCEEVLEATEYNIYRNVNGLYGYIGTSQATEDAIIVENNVKFSGYTSTTNSTTGAVIVSIKLASCKYIYAKDSLAVNNMFYEDNTLKTYYGTCTALTNTSKSKLITLKRKGMAFVDDNIEPDLSSCAPVVRNPFEDGNYPSCCCYFQQRKLYGNSYNNPQTLWSSQTGAINNFNISRPLIATDAVTLNLDDREVNEIRHLLPMKDLIALTSNSEWKINGTDGIFQANPMPASVIQSCYGASHVEPVVSGSMVIFVQAGGSVVRDLGYDIMSEGYDGDELSLFSSHLFEGKEVVYMAYAREPYRLLYVIFNDGSAATMTYNKKQKLCGWTRFETEGTFESVDVVREGLEDVAYFVINRTVNGQNVKFIERTRTRIIDDAKYAFLVDCGLDKEYKEPRTLIEGLDHLEGKTVIANVNGGIVENLVVKNGTVTLSKPAKTIVVGLPFEFDFETLNIEGENTQGLKKVINHVCLKVYKSREDVLFCGTDGREFRHNRCDASINDSGKLFSTDLSMTVTAYPKADATIRIKQNYPLPLTILSVSATVAVQDNENG